jgi:3-phenylpropionate/cinnamic acid dioxygenase small subunit
MNAHQSLIDFVYHEARLIDEQRFDEWLDLFIEDGRYWMPLTRGQPEALTHTSLFYVDKLLLKVRIERLKNPHAFSQVPRSHCQHVLQTPKVESVGADGVTILRKPFFYMEAQLDEQLMLAGTVWHHLVATADGPRILLKKVELVNCDAAMPGIQLFP